MSAPSLSVLMPNYNHARHLRRAIEAVATQSRPPDEFIIVDDASTDDSVAIVEAHAREHPFLRLIRHETNAGVVAACDTLLAAARGDWVLFTAADDYVLPGFFAGAMAMAERHPQAGVVMGMQVVVDDDDQEIRVHSASRWPTPRYAAPEVFLREYLEVEPPGQALTSASLSRREALVEIGGYPRQCGSWADTFVLRALGLRYGVCYVPERWAAFRASPGGFGASVGRDQRRLLEVLDAGVALMRSSEFRDIFPEWHVRRWQRRYQREVFEQYVWARRERFGPGRRGLWLGRLYKRALLLQVALRHGGDLGAFLHAQLDEE